ncbi:LytR/AlgR family response regulator transcription factor [Algibacter sp. L3A6]|uniref:LytR/AlgR family response regulator transcription factor n=1 Tax=Algibacter sp. L3A6 TaxID=2686366 RepID=UPI00131DE022|nr:LytTR family DNA-binding domain-containing protein [Algibacter sp. L3A6]
MIKAIALDDEPLALEVIMAYCEQIECVDLIHTFTSQEKAIKYLNKFDVDLLFLDIHMPKLNGIDLYKSLKHNVKVVFTTAYSNYAVEGFNVNASDYLLKPFSFDRFFEATEKVNKEIKLEKNEPLNHSNLAIRADYKLYNIAFEDIVLIEALDDYIGIHLQNKTKIVARYTMKNILKKLPELEFQRVHRSYIVALKKVKTIYKDTLEIEAVKIPISATYKDEVVKKLRV